MNENWNFQKDWGRVIYQKTSIGGVWTFSGTIYTFCSFNINVNKLFCTVYYSVLLTGTLVVVYFFYFFSPSLD